MKTCNGCKKEKPESEFYWSGPKGGSRRPHSRCKECETVSTGEYKKTRREQYNVYQRAAYERDPEYFRKKARESYARNRVARLAQKKLRREEIRREVISRYSNGTNLCACCGEDNYDFLTLDHIENDGAKHRKEFGGRSNYDGDNFYKSLLVGEKRDDIQVLCMNCNWGKRHNNGVCPHQEGSTTIPKGSTVKRPEAQSTH